jgi:Tfp pilus assembly protein PilF
MKNFKLLLLVSILATFLVSCSTDYMAEGEKALSNGDLNQAKKIFAQGMVENTEMKDKFKVKIDLINLKLALNDFNKNKKVSRFYGQILGNMKDEIDDNTPAEIRNAYVEARIIVAKDFFAKGDFTNARKYTGFVLDIDENNADAKKINNDILASQKDELFAKGVGEYENAKKKKFNGGYLNAKKYLLIARDAGYDKKKCDGYLDKIDKATAKVLDDLNETYPFAIAKLQENKYDKKNIIAYMRFYNNSGEAIAINNSNFYLLDNKGKRISFDAEKTAKYIKDTKKHFPNGSVKPGELVEGLMTFSGTNNISAKKVWKVVFKSGSIKRTKYAQ